MTTFSLYLLIGLLVLCITPNDKAQPDYKRVLAALSTLLLWPVVVVLAIVRTGGTKNGRYRFHDTMWSECNQKTIAKSDADSTSAKVSVGDVG